MKTEEKEKMHVYGVKDDKARRVLNTSSKTANITAEQIEQGVTLEELCNINVPVYRYQTQVTIHGNMPDFNPLSRPAGYKSIFKNENGSLGVRYIAVDAAKKETIRRAINLSGSAWRFAQSSTDTQLWKSAKTKEDVIKTANSIPRDKFIGCSYIAKDPYRGCFYCIMDISAIPVNTLWPLISWVTTGKVNTQAELDTLKAAYDDKRAAGKVQYEKERAEKDAEKERQKAVIIAQWEKDNYTYYKGDKFDGLYLIRPITHSEKAFVHTLYRKHGKKFKSSRVESDSREKLPVDLFVKWRFPGKYYGENTSGFILPAEKVEKGAVDPVTRYVKTDPEAATSGVTIIEYSDKAVAVIGDTRPIKDTLRSLGGRFNPRLTCGPGWIFPATRRDNVRAALAIA